VKLSVLHEDNHLLVVNKPSGLATMGVSQGTMSLVVLAKDYLKRKYNKPGNVYLGVVSRLDRLASGAIVLARTSKAAARLTRLFAENRVEKTYWTLVTPPPRDPEAVLEDWVRKNESLRRMEVTVPKASGAQWARLTYRQRGRGSGGEATRGGGEWAWLEIQLETGRKHQIRLQLSRIGSPILGDSKYGATAPFSHGIALHARRIQLEHPVQHVPLDLTAPLPATWRRYAQEWHLDAKDLQ
jgi:23S rRNA pseudouridine1911/1915/1917 synthase